MSLRPFVLVALAVVLPGAGGALALLRVLERPVRKVEVDGLHLRLERAAWTEDHLEHTARDRMPEVMMPGFPARGTRRFGVELSVFNGSSRPVSLASGQVALRAEDGREFPPEGPAARVVGPGQSLTAGLVFDVPEGAGALTLQWRHGEGQTRLLDTRAPSPRVLAATPVSPWPEAASDLPEGDAEAGRTLFFGEAACAACHGAPDGSAKPALGPALGRVGAKGAQALYESILEPDRVIAEGCPGGPCPSPSTMPFYGDRLSPRQMADLVAFLLQPQAAPSPVVQETSR